MLGSDSILQPAPRTLREFAIIWLLFFLIFAIWGLVAWHGLHDGLTDWATDLELVAVAIGLIGVLRPGVMRPIYVGWMLLVFPIGWTVSHLLLAIVFYGVLTPIGLGLRLFGRNALGRRRTQVESYWEPRVGQASASSYYRQF
jgi:hypothetical protein